MSFRNSHASMVAKMTSHGERRIRERVMNQEKFATSDPGLLADMALHKGRKPRRGFVGTFAHRPDGFEKFLYREYLGMIYVFGVEKKTATLLTVYYPEQRTYIEKLRAKEQGEKPQSTPVSVESTNTPYHPCDNCATVMGLSA